MAYLVPYHPDTQPFNPKQDDFANSVFIAGAALDSCDIIEQSDSQISEDGENNHLPLGDGQYWTTVNVTNSKQPEQNDPGPSVQFRTPVEVKAIMDAQVEHPNFPGLDAHTLLPLLSNLLTVHEKRFRDMHPERTELDWDKGIPKALKSSVCRRAALGQLCGVQGPANEKCTACTEGRNAFEHCRIVFLGNQVQWGWACAGCVFRGNTAGCSLRPDRFVNVPTWVAEAVAEHDASNELLAAYHAGKKDGAVVPAPTGKRRPRVGYSPMPSRKKKVSSTCRTNAMDENQFINSYKPDVATEYVHVKLKNGGLPFNGHWYHSPLEDPDVYRMQDKAQAIKTFNELAEVVARATEDYGRMKAALFLKGFLPTLADQELDEENVFAEE